MRFQLVVMCGLPGSGKSTFAEKLSSAEGHTILSSDQLREEMFGDVNNQNNNGKVFEELHRRARELLEAGEKVIIDATNTNRKRRIHLANTFKQYTKAVYYMNVPMAVASLQNENRERKVPEFVIDRMYKNLHVPTFSEGWDDVVLVQNDKAKWMDSIRRRKYEHLLMQNPGLVLMDEIARFSPEMNECMFLRQDNPHHKWPVHIHIYQVYKHIHQNYQGDDKLMMLWTAIFHDVGKAYTKVFHNRKGEPTDIAHYYGHENVSAQIACYHLSRLGYDSQFVLDVCELVQHHMAVMRIGEKSEKKLINLIGRDKYEKLLAFREADMAGKGV